MVWILRIGLLVDTMDFDLPAKYFCMGADPLHSMGRRVTPCVTHYRDVYEHHQQLNGRYLIRDHRNR